MPGLRLFLDFEKAFDSVVSKFMFKSFTCFWIGV